MLAWHGFLPGTNKATKLKSTQILPFGPYRTSQSGQRQSSRRSTQISRLSPPKYAFKECLKCHATIPRIDCFLAAKYHQPLAMLMIITAYGLRLLFISFWYSDLSILSIIDMSSLVTVVLALLIKCRSEIDIRLLWWGWRDDGHDIIDLKAVLRLRAGWMPGWPK